MELKLSYKKNGEFFVSSNRTFMELKLYITYW